MKIKYYQNYTRPSLDHFFANEIPDNEFEPIILNGEFVYCSEFITWSELISKKHELRPDLLHWFDVYSESEFLKSEIWGLGPHWNPLSLNLTYITTFSNYNDAMQAYDLFKENLESFKTYVQKNNNTYSERLEYENGEPVLEFVSVY